MYAVIVRINGWEKIVEIDSYLFLSGCVKVSFPSKVDCINRYSDEIVKNATFPIFYCFKTGQTRSGMHIFEPR